MRKIMLASFFLMILVILWIGNANQDDQMTISNSTINGAGEIVDDSTVNTFNEK